MIKNFNTQEERNAYIPDNTESTLMHVEETNEVSVNGVNVVLTKSPEVGDVVYLDESGNTVFVKGLTRSEIPASWTLVGFVFNRRGNEVKIIDKNIDGTRQWLSCWQYAITAISSTDITFYLRMKGDYATFVTINVSLTSAAINATTVAEINAALEAAGNAGNIGYANHGYWAYLADDNNMPSDAGTRIVVQCDFCADYRQYMINDGSHVISGCTMALVVWEDMPANANYWKANGATTNYAGYMNKEKFKSYYAVNGRTPTAQEPLQVTGNTTPVKLADFNSNAFCADIRAAYGTYEKYIEVCFATMYPQKYGVFSLMDAKEMTAKYGKSYTLKKNGDVLYKFPAIHYGTTVGYGTGGLAQGNWWLTDVTDGMELYEDETYNILRASQESAGAAKIVNNAGRWLARRYNVYIAWVFGGGYGTLSSTNVNIAFRVAAVTLLKIKS